MNKDLDRVPAASQHRVTDAAHEAPSGSSPSGSVPTGAGRLGLLRDMLDRDIAREGEMHSTMVRAGLLRDILDELERHRSTVPGLYEALVRIADLGDDDTPSAEREARIAWIDAELEAEPYRSPYGRDDEPPCRNGYEVSVLVMERAGLIALAALAKASVDRNPQGGDASSAAPSRSDESAVTAKPADAQTQSSHPGQEENEGETSNG